jgi:outer membrane protein OmpA-like peptidoglycan-associated protein/tetratricopeptide (TPR) repeat protein
MKRVFPVLVVLFFALAQVAIAQNNSPIVKAEKLHKAFAYHEAIEEYNKALLKEPDNAKALRGLADCYRMTNNTDKAELFYARVAKLEDAKPIDKFYYAQSLMYNEKYEEAKKYFSEYSASATSDERAQNSLAAISKLDEFFKDSARVRIHKIAINTDKADFSPVYYGEGVVFVSSRESGAKDKTHSWTGNPYLALYYAKGSDAALRSPEVFARDMEIKFNDGPVCFNRSGNEMYLTRNNSTVSNRTDKIAKLKIVHSKFSDGRWSSPVDLPFVSNKFNTAHAWLSADENRLYFASDMPGGYGGMDLYYSDRTKDGWASPINLGNKINTKGNELFPFVNEDNTLYFSSDGQVGLGGLDIYECTYKDGTWQDPKNMGYPINTHKDDFGLILVKDGTKGYLSSNRNGGKGDDDVYFTEIFKKIFVFGTVTDKRSGQVIGDAEVVLKDREGKQITAVRTNADGYYEIELDFNKDYTLLAQKEGYSKETKTVSTFNLKSPRIEQNFQLEKVSYGIEGVVSDKGTKEPLDKAEVALFDKSGKEVGKVTTGPDGYYYIEVKPDMQYKIKGAREGYFAKTDMVSTKGMKPGVMRKDIELEKLILNKPIRLDNIYYDLNKWNIRADAAKELDKLVQILKDNPTIVIELSSHTDSRASDQYNMDLSDKRAKSAATYIVEKGGIARERITGKGYGESMLINHCTNGVKCSEELHQENRRTEFKVLKF